LAGITDYVGQKLGVRAGRRRAGVAASLVAACAALALVAYSCAPQQPPPPPPPPPRPAPTPSGPPNYAHALVGTWYASYPGGPLKVNITLDHWMRGVNYVATLVDGNQDMPPGTVAWRGKPDTNVLNLVVGEQLCAEAGHVRVTSQNVTMQVADTDHFTENLVRRGSCQGYPVNWVRVKGQ
jgi:hypothetical protein